MLNSVNADPALPDPIDDLGLSDPASAAQYFLSGRGLKDLVEGGKIGDYTSQFRPREKWSHELIVRQGSDYTLELRAGKRQLGYRRQAPAL